MATDRGHSGAERVDRLGTGSISKLLFEFAVPAIIGIVVNGLYNVIDAAFLGHGVGSIGLAATTVAFPTMVVFMALSMLIGQGGNALAAIRLGEGRRDEAERILGNAFALLAIMGVAVAVIGLFAIDPLLRLSGATDDVLPYSRTFVRIVCAGFIFQGVGLGINNFIRTAGEPGWALGTMVIGTFTCILCNYLFVIRWGFGIAGSAWATVLGQAVSSIAVTGFFCSRKASFRFHLRNLRLDLSLDREVLALGLAPCALQMASAIVNIVLNNVLVIYGSTSAIGSEGALAVIGVIGKIAAFAIFPILGVAMGAQPLLGYNYGAHRFDRVRRTFRTAVIWGTVIVCALFAFIQLFPSVVVGLFGIEPELTAFANQGLRIYTASFPIVAFQIIGSNYFQATGQPVKAMFLSLTRQLIFLIPLTYALPQVLPALVPQVSSLLAICFAAPCSDLLSFMFTTAFIAHDFRRLARIGAQEASTA